jgi:hypothetical protein
MVASSPAPAKASDTAKRIHDCLNGRSTDIAIAQHRRRGGEASVRIPDTSRLRKSPQSAGGVLKVPLLTQEKLTITKSNDVCPPPRQNMRERNIAMSMKVIARTIEGWTQFYSLLNK